jgi:predicted dehydrogenase
MRKLGIALVGLDHWYSALETARQIGRSDKVQLVAVAHDDEAKAQGVARDHSSAMATTDPRAAMAQPGVDIVVAFYSTDRNVDICVEAAGLGKHITSVKPMAMDMAGVERIGAAVKSAGIYFFPYDCLQRLNPARQQYRQWITEGRIGQPLRYTQTLNGSLPKAWPDSDDTGWWTDPARSPGGGWIDHSIYAIDTVRWLFQTEPTSVQGVVANLSHPDLGMEDYGASTYTFANGAVALIEDTWAAERGSGFSRQEIIGSAGAIAEDTSAWGRVAARGNFGYEGWVAMEPNRAPSQPVVDHLADCIHGDATPAATFEDGRANLAACFAFYEAAKAGKRLPL